MIVAVAFGATLYGFLVAALYLYQRSLLYHPDSSVPLPHAHGVPEMLPLRIAVEPGVDILAWWQPPADAGKPVVIYFHGNAGHLGERGYKIRHFIDAGYGVLLTTWRYNAGGGGQPSEVGLLADADAALSHVAGLGIAPMRIALYGESLGSGVAVALAARHEVGGLILETPYSSVADVAQAHYWYVPARWLIRDRYDSVSRIGEVRAPIMLLHGDADTTIPIRFARRLHDAAPSSTEAHFFPGGGHTDLYDRGAARLVIDFLERHAALAAREGVLPAFKEG